MSQLFGVWLTLGFVKKTGADFLTDLFGVDYNRRAAVWKAGAKRLESERELPPRLTGVCPTGGLPTPGLSLCGRFAAALQPLCRGTAAAAPTSRGGVCGAVGSSPPPPAACQATRRQPPRPGGQRQKYPLFKFFIRFLKFIGLFCR